MKIEKYNPKGLNESRIVKSESEMVIIAASGGNEKGTLSNPYTVTEYIYLYLHGAWSGGYVENAGYVGKDDNYIEFSEFDMDSYFSDVFAFLSRDPNSSGFSLPVISSSNSSASAGTSKNHSTDGQPDGTTSVESKTVILDGVIFDVRLVKETGWMLVSIAANTKKQAIQDGLYSLGYIVDGTKHEVDLCVDGYSSDGNYIRIIFKVVIIPCAYGGWNVWLQDNRTDQKVNI